VARGRKIGFTKRNLWVRYGVQERLVQPRIEPEIGFGLRVAPRDRSPEALLEAIAWVTHTIEIVQCHHPGWKVTVADCAADNGLDGRLVVGAQIPVGEIEGLVERLPAVEVRLAHDGHEVDRGVGANVLGSPLESLGYLVDLLARQPEAPPLAAGDVVTTGVLTDAHPVAAGERWSTSLRGLPLRGLTRRVLLKGPPTRSAGPPPDIAGSTRAA
jgi:2-oxo-3-hexenedioate decarboxylase